MALILAQSFWDHYGASIAKAAGTIVIALLAVTLANRWLDRRGMQIVAAVSGGHLSQANDTRLRFTRRAVDATIITIAIAAALSQFTALDKIGQAVLASGAIAAAVVGFAARQTLANAIAGLFLAVTQPLRIGDVVTFEGESGVVEDIRLTSTWLRTPNQARVIVPNERLAGGVLRNDSIVDAVVAVEASLWLPADRDAIVALDRIRTALPELTVRLAETTADGARLLLVDRPAAPGDRAVREAELREGALRALGE
ncbi:mechanosensitive ion channel family protein [Paraconexibacter antarcticus]|uniref:Mechanosensitive ion channel family protein n=1 Tax=Paraconexibacter antarcticus TaxID=2949664 RepID=A0ABY5DV68_9ACTN|nr:mechanosensitive ion channel domain-containing protein [Paraconexibacter antarcticus]UTI64545.1 mechanosensitive ion channel family protein [Paraconexibacter antarcticus]